MLLSGITENMEEVKIMRVYFKRFVIFLKDFIVLIQIYVYLILWKMEKKYIFLNITNYF